MARHRYVSDHLLVQNCRNSSALAMELLHLVSFIYRASIEEWI